MIFIITSVRFCLRSNQGFVPVGLEPAGLEPLEENKKKSMNIYINYRNKIKIECVLKINDKNICVYHNLTNCGLASGC